MVILVVGIYDAVISKMHTWFSLLASKIKVLSPLQFPEWQVREVAFALILAIYVFVIYLLKPLKTGPELLGGCAERLAGPNSRMTDVPVVLSFLNFAL